MYSKVYSELESFGFRSISKSKYKVLNKMGIKTLYDLIYFFPRTYENKAKLKKISELKENENVMVLGKVSRVTSSFFSNKKIIKVYLENENDVIELLWFNSPYMENSLNVGDEILVTGKVKRSRLFQMINPSYRKIKNNIEIQNSDSDDLEPIYSLSNGIKQKEISQIIQEGLKKFIFLFKENLPKTYIVKNKLLDREKAILNIHFPRNKEIYNEAIRRMIYEEALIIEMKILKNRYLQDKSNSNIYFIDDNKELVKKYISGLKFELTLDQKKVITEIYKEIKKGKIINRLIQGDVGSGKTIVSLILLLYMAENKYQGVIMAPTEILARQHYLEVIEEFKKLDITVEFLSSSTKAKKKKEIYEKVKDGSIDILIGTHSLLDNELEFKKLGLIIIDEQHKFGVEQRNKLRDKSLYSNLIVMSATPIPRSLALTVYGDLDVSIISQMPLGRKPIITKWVKNKKEKEIMYKFIEEKIKEGRQVYVVSPLIDVSEKLDLDSAIKSYEDYSERFKKYTVGLLHGKLSTKEKDIVMEEFKNQHIDILVSTSVVEVGVNVPNASIIVILSAERFGLSSLHQLRGRVGRGSYESNCFLVSDSKNEVAQKRLNIMEETLDGFKVAEQDLILRDTGEIFGMKQSGLTDLKFLDIVKNVKEISIAKEFCKEYLEEHNGSIEDDILLVDINKAYSNN